MNESQPDTLIAAREGSPLGIGIGPNEHFLASDDSPIVEYINDLVFINNYENLFRNMVYQNPAERNVVLGPLEGNGFIRKDREASVEFHRKIDVWLPVL